MTVIIDKWFNIISEKDVRNKIANKNVIIFGKSKKNTLIYNNFSDVVFTEIFDNNEKICGQYDNGIEITKPSFYGNTVIISALRDYLHLVPQLKALGYQEYYFIWHDEHYKKIVKAKEFINDTKETFVWKDGSYEHIHIFPDQKFLPPIAYILEHSGDIKKHAFIIYAFNISNYNDTYNMWSLYERLAKQYGNVAIIGNLYSIDDCYQRRINTILRNLETCRQVIFHGEWLDDEIYEMFIPYINILRNKGVFIPWNGLVGKHEHTNKYIHGLLRYCKLIVMNPNWKRFKEAVDDCKLHDNIFFEKELDYTQPIIRKYRPNNIKPKILVSHSGVLYTRAAEGIVHLSKFIGKIEVYSVLSYGSDEEIQDVIIIGNQIFGSDFHPITRYMTYEEYANFLSDMDAAVWAMTDGAGHTTMLLLAYMGVTLYFKKGSLTEEYANEYGLKCYNYYDVPDINVTDFKINEFLDNNYEVIKYKFDINERLNEWNQLFTIKA